MLELLRLSNFQVHSYLEIELDPKVTSIVGASDVGKSSVIRALRWACLNVSVSSLIKDGCKTAAVKVTVDGHAISRQRGSDNLYLLDEQEFRAFRTDVPQSIARLLNLDELNFQSQHDPVFWFSLTAGDVSRQLNAAVDLEIIDATLAEITKTYNRARTVAQLSEERLATAVQEKVGLEWVTEALDDWHVTEDWQERAGGLRLAIVGLSGKIDDAWDKNGIAARLKGAAGDGDGVVLIAHRLGSLGSEIRKLAECVSSAEKAAEEKDVELPDTTDISLLAGRVGDLRKKATDLEDVVARAFGARQRASLDKIAVMDAEEELKRKTGDRCPLCGKEMVGL